MKGEPQAFVLCGQRGFGSLPSKPQRPPRSRATSQETFKSERAVIKNSARMTGLSQADRDRSERQSKSDREGVKGQLPPPAPSTFVDRGSNSLWPIRCTFFDRGLPTSRVELRSLHHSDLEWPLSELNSFHVTPHPKA